MRLRDGSGEGDGGGGPRAGGAERKTGLEGRASDGALGPGPFKRRFATRAHL